MPIASLHLRVLAKFIDFLICFFISLILTYLLGKNPLGEYSQIPNIVFVILFVLSDASHGQSIGKKLCNIRVVNFKTQAPIGLGRSLLRNLFALLNFLVLPAVLNYILYVSYYRRLGDFIAGTCVVIDTK